MSMAFDWDDQFDDFLKSLPTKAEAKLLALIEKIEIHGLNTAIKLQWVKKLESNLYEIRVSHDGLFLRGLYFQKVSDQYFITHGFKKKSNQTPEKEKQRARLIRYTYFRDNNK